MVPRMARTLLSCWGQVIIFCLQVTYGMLHRNNCSYREIRLVKVQLIRCIYSHWGFSFCLGNMVCMFHIVLMLFLPRTLPTFSKPHFANVKDRLLIRTWCDHTALHGTWTTSWLHGSLSFGQSFNTSGLIRLFHFVSPLKHQLQFPVQPVILCSSSSRFLRLYIYTIYNRERTTCRRGRVYTQYSIEFPKHTTYCKISREGNILAHRYTLGFPACWFE